jgi:hypothetical protein
MDWTTETKRMRKKKKPEKLTFPPMLPSSSLILRLRFLLRLTWAG